MNSPVPGLVRSLAALASILRKGEMFCRDNGLDAAEMLEARMAPTMKPLTHQIRLACNGAAEAAAQIAFGQGAVIEGRYESFADLQQSIAAAVMLIEAIPSGAFAEVDERVIVVGSGDEAEPYPAHRYLMEYAMPNFYFATTTAYNLLRKQGVPLGKTDFLGV